MGEALQNVGETETGRIPKETALPLKKQRFSALPWSESADPMGSGCSDVIPLGWKRSC